MQEEAEQVCPQAPRARRTRTLAQMESMAKTPLNEEPAMWKDQDGKGFFGSLPSPTLRSVQPCDVSNLDNSPPESSGSKDSSSGESQDISTGSWSLLSPRRGVYDLLLDCLDEESMPSFQDQMLPKSTASRKIVESMNPSNWAPNLSE